MTARRLLPALVVLVAAAAAIPMGASGSVPDPRGILAAMGHAASDLRDYTMTLVTQEWDGDRLGSPQTLTAKWARPFQVYYKRLCEPHKGREILFAEGWNGGKLKVSLNTWPKNIRLNLDPHGALAMGGTRHPVDQTSIVFLVDVVLENFRKADARGEASVAELGVEPVFDRPCDHVRVTVPWTTTRYTIAAGETLWDVGRKFDMAMAPLLHVNRELGWETPSDARPGQTVTVPRYYAARIDLWIDRELRLPLRAEIYDGAGVMFERFEHRDLRVNVGLRPIDFSPKNPEYKF